jgi:hypothetical protein
MCYRQNAEDSFRHDRIAARDDVKRRNVLNRGAAGNKYGFTGYPARIIRGQKRHWRRNVFRLSRAAQGGDR